MRLIDADEFKRYISEGYEERKNEFKTEEYRNIAYEATKGFILDIDEQPTVYDIDKVVEKLEEYKTKAYYEATSVKNSFPLGANWAYQEAIKIVKLGGLNETD